MFKLISRIETKELQKIDIFKDVEYITIQVGWLETLKELGLDLQNYCIDNNIPYPKISDIKTKYGKLRVYHDKIDNKDLILQLQKWYDKLNNTCEHCASNEGVKTIIRGRYILTLCKNHLEENDVNYDVMFN